MAECDDQGPTQEIIKASRMTEAFMVKNFVTQDWWLIQHAWLLILTAADILRYFFSPQRKLPLVEWSPAPDDRCLVDIESAIKRGDIKWESNRGLTRVERGSFMTWAKKKPVVAHILMPGVPLSESRMPLERLVQLWPEIRDLRAEDRMVEAPATTEAAAGEPEKVHPDSEEWLTVTEAARLLVKELCNEIELSAAKKRISQACSTGILIHKGEKRNRRISPNSLASFISTAKVKANAEPEDLSRSIAKAPERARTLAETAKKIG